MAFYSAALVTAAALTIYSCGSVAMTVEQKWLAQTGGGMEAEEQGLFSQAYSVPDQIVGSVERMDEGFLFQIPADTPFPEKLDIHIAGRVEYGDGFSASVHYLEEENRNWVPGKAYFISADPACTELTLDVSCPDEEGKLLHRTVDLLEIR